MEVTTGTEYLDGREQVVIRTDGEHFQQVTTYLAQAFGPPSQPVTPYTNNGLWGWYTGSEIGIGLLFGRTGDETIVSVTGELKR